MAALFYGKQVGCMTRSPVEFKDSTMIVGLLQILNIHFDSPCDEYLLLWFMMVRSYKTDEMFKVAAHN